MPGTDVRTHDEAHDKGLSPVTWWIILTAVAIGVGNLLAAQTWIKPDWHRWWLPVLILEVLVYSLTLIIPPTGRLSVTHGALRVAVGMGTRLVVVLANAAFGLRGGGSTFLGAVQVYWAGHWPAAMGEIACVAIAVYWFRYLSVQRVLRTRVVKHEAVPAVLDPAKRPREALVDELTGRGAEQPAASAVTLAEPQAPGAPFRTPRGVEEAVAQPSAPEPDLAGTRVQPVPPSAAPEVAPEIGAGLTTIRLPAEVVLRALPGTMLTEPVDALLPQLEDADVSLPWGVIAPQLGTGEVWMEALPVLQQLPDTVLAAPATRCAEQLAEGLMLPLAEIVMRVPPEVFAPPADQEPGAELPGGPPIFRETGSPPAVPSAAYVPLAPAAPSPPVPSIASPAPGPLSGPAVPQGPPPIAVPGRAPKREPEAPAERSAAAPNAQDEEARRERALAAAISALQRPVPTPPATEEAPGPVAAEEEPSFEPAGAPVEPAAEEAPQEPEPAIEEEPEPGVVAVEDEPRFEPLAALEPAEEGAPQEPEPGTEEEPEPEAVAVEEPEPVAASAEPDEEPAALPEPSVVDTLFAFPAGWPTDESPEEHEPQPVAVLTEPTEEEALGEPEALAEEESEPEVVAEEEAEPVAASVEPREEPLPVAEPSVVVTLVALPENVPPVEAVEPAAEVPPEAPEPEPAFAARGVEPIAEPAIHEPQPVALEAPLLEPETETTILNALRGAGVLRLDLVSREGLTVVVADGSERVDGAVDLTEGVLSLASAGGGHLSFALVTGARGATFIGGTDQAPGAYLAVTSEGASAGQVSVAARRAVGLLGRLSIGVPYAPSIPPPASEDSALAAVADGTGESASGGFRLPSGSGVMVFGFDPPVAAVVAAAAADAWNAAKVSQAGRLDRVLLVASDRTLGVSVSAEASALVVAAFEPGMNLGLAGAALNKLVRACDQAAARRGL